MMKPVSDFAALPPGMAQKIKELGWPAVQGEIDEAFGCAKVTDLSKAVWTTEGKRIEVLWLEDGGYIVSQSKEVDPIYAERKGEGNAG